MHCSVLHPDLQGNVGKSSKGNGTSVAVLHLYDSLHQKCSKLGTYTTQGLKNNFYFRGFSLGSGPKLSISDEYRQFFRFLTKFQKFHSPKKLKYLTGDVSKVISRL
jgi:hypothetical protein